MRDVLLFQLYIVQASMKLRFFLLDGVLSDIQVEYRVRDSKT